MYVCFCCGKHYLPSDSLAANTEELYATTYCSRECQDRDTEQMERDIAQAAKEAEALPESTKVPIIEEIKAGGFNLKVRVK